MASTPAPRQRRETPLLRQLPNRASGVAGVAGVGTAGPPVHGLAVQAHVLHHVDAARRQGPLGTGAICDLAGLDAVFYPVDGGIVGGEVAVDARVRRRRDQRGRGTAGPVGKRCVHDRGAVVEINVVVVRAQDREVRVCDGGRRDGPPAARNPPQRIPIREEYSALGVEQARPARAAGERPAGDRLAGDGPGGRRVPERGR